MPLSPRETNEIAGRVRSLAAVLASEAALTPVQVQLLEAFSVLVRRWSGVAGLVSKGDLPHFAHRHLLDSLAAAKVVRKIQGASELAGMRLVDLGSGAGLPGVPLAVALPEVGVTLVERSAKKARFLNRVRRELDLPNVDVRCVDLANMPANCCDVVTARALLSPPALWRSASKMLRPNGFMLAFAGSAPPAGAKAKGRALHGFPGGSVEGRHWANRRSPAQGSRPSAAVRPSAGGAAGGDGCTPCGALLVVRKDDPNHSGGQSEGRRRQDHDER